MTHRRHRVIRAAAILLAAAAAAQAEEPRPGAGRHRGFSVPVEVKGLPPGAEGAPVAWAIDFSALLARAGAPGTADPRTLRLVRILPGGGEAETPVQLTHAPQPRAGGRAMLPGTVPGVSYAAEYAAGQAPPEIKTAGTLAWMACADEKGQARYRLEFGVLRAGRLVQVPYEPADLHAFDEEGRATPLRVFPRMQVRPQWPLEGRLHVLDAGQLVATYFVGPGVEDAKAGRAALRRPFLYPVNGPGGASLTEFGKAHDPTGSHAHHYSLWIAHSNVAGKDFWSERGGAIAHAGLELLEDGPVFCRVVQKTLWMDGESPLLRERRGLTVYAAPPGRESPRLVDVQIELEPAGVGPVELGKTTFGLLAVRVAQSMTVFDGGGEILNARGQRNEQGAHLQRAEWLDQSGPIAPGAGPPDAPPRWAGIAVLDHPANPNHPTTWHCRNDGWAGASLSAEGPRAIQPGEPLRARYRIVLHEGSAAEGHVARRYAEYAAQPAVTVGEAQERR